MLFIILVIVIGGIVVALDVLNQAVSDLKASVAAVGIKIQILSDKIATAVDADAVAAAAADIKAESDKLIGLSN
jgi:hypothetical protein